MSQELFASHGDVAVQDVVLYDTGFRTWPEKEPVMAVGWVASIYREEEGQPLMLQVQPWQFQRWVPKTKAALCVETDQWASIPWGRVAGTMPADYVEPDDTISPTWIRDNLPKSVRNQPILLHQYQECDGERFPSAPPPVRWFWTQFEFHDPTSELWDLPFVKQWLWDWQVHPASGARRNLNKAQWDLFRREVLPKVGQGVDWKAYMKEKQEWAVWGNESHRVED